MNTQLPISSSGVKRLGELLVEADLLSPEDLKRGLEYGTKTTLPIGRVLVMLKLVDDENLRAALHIQSLMRFEKMPGTFAVRALKHMISKKVPIEESCRQLGWTSDKSTAKRSPRLRELKDRLTDAENRLGYDHPELAAVMLEIASFYEDEEMWPHAEAQMEAAIRQLENAYGKIDLKVARAVAKLSHLLFMQDRYPEAQTLAERVVDIRRQLLGPDDPDLAFALFDLAELFDVQKKWAEAESCYIQTLTALEAEYDCDEQPILDVLKRLAYVCKRRSTPAQPMMIGTLLTGSGLVDKDKLPEALRYSTDKGIPLARALITLNYLSDEQLRPVLHIQLLIKSNLLPSQLAIHVLRISIKRSISLDEAILLTGWKLSHGQSHELELLLKTNDELLEAEKALSPDDPQIARLCICMGDIFESYERYADAEIYFKRALKIGEKTSQDTAAIISLLDHLGLVYLRLYNFDMADISFKRALELKQRELGEHHPEIATSYQHLGRLHISQHNHDAAIIYLQRALPLAEKYYGQDHLEVSNIAEQLALSYYETEQYGRAEPFFWQAYNIKRGYMSNQSHEIVELLNTLADMYNRDGRSNMAESVFALLRTDKHFVV